MTGTTDGRRLRGERTRRTAARTAADIATTHGLDSVTVGTLATATGLSKSGILTVFGTREAILVAAVAEARRVYLAHVVAPVWHREPGRERLHALLDAWVDHLRARVFPGGCFISATSAEFGHRDGPVAEAVRKLKREWLDLLEADLAVAGARSPSDDAFAVDALLVAGNVRRELFGSDDDLDRARRLAGAVVDAAG
jgi:AcrR family transcriptional regulator